MTPEDDYRRRITALKALDIDGFISTMDDASKAHFYSLSADKQRDAAMGTMHKVRYEMPEMTQYEREVSRQWLEKHGLKRLKGKDFPPRTPDSTF